MEPDKSLVLIVVVVLLAMGGGGFTLLVQGTFGFAKVKINKKALAIAIALSTFIYVGLMFLIIQIQLADWRVIDSFILFGIVFWLMCACYWPLSGMISPEASVLKNGTAKPNQKPPKFFAIELSIILVLVSIVMSVWLGTSISGGYQAILRAGVGAITLACTVLWCFNGLLSLFWNWVGLRFLRYVLILGMYLGAYGGFLYGIYAHINWIQLGTFQEIIKEYWWVDLNSVFLLWFTGYIANHTKP